jgi:copper chaperone CopZ
MKDIKVKITGIRPLVLHNGLMADPTNELVRAIKKITSKGTKKMTDSDYIERDRLEWEAGLYWSEEAGGIAIPSDNLERCIQDGAKKNRLGKDFAAAVFVQESEVTLAHRLAGKSKDEIREDEGYTLRKGVKVQLSRIIRIRPLIPTGWSLTFTIEYDESIVNRQDVIQALTEAGALVGLGDWRPKFGRFTVEALS